jgi:hypothetical protein
MLPEQKSSRICCCWDRQRCDYYLMIQHFMLDDAILFSASSIFIIDSRPCSTSQIAHLHLQLTQTILASSVIARTIDKS